jgi:hypothetical protein
VPNKRKASAQNRRERIYFTAAAHTGYSIYYVGDFRHGFANPGTKDCIYYLANYYDSPTGRGER